MRSNNNDEFFHLSLLCNQPPQNTAAWNNRRFCVSGIGAGHSGDGFPVFYNVWGLSWETRGLEGGLIPLMLASCGRIFTPMSGGSRWLLASTPTHMVSSCGPASSQPSSLNGLSRLPRWMSWEKVEAAGVLRPEPGNWHNVTPTMFYWSSSHIGPISWWEKWQRRIMFKIQDQLNSFKEREWL